MYAGAISRNPGAVAAMFTEYGVYEAPLIPDGHRLPRRLAGRDAIRAGLSTSHRGLASQVGVPPYPALPPFPVTVNMQARRRTADEAIVISITDFTVILIGSS